MLILATSSTYAGQATLIKSSFGSAKISIKSIDKDMPSTKVIVKTSDNKFEARTMDGMQIFSSNEDSSIQEIYPDNELSVLEDDSSLRYTNNYMSYNGDETTLHEIANGNEKVLSDNMPYGTAYYGTYNVETSLKFHKMSPTENLTGEDVRICILDTGIYKEHDYFKNNDIITADFTGDEISNTADDDHGHGTHVAGVIAKAVPYATLLVGKVCDKYGSCMESDIINAMYWCNENNAKIISMSLGFTHYEDDCNNYAISQVVNELADEGILSSMAAGNLQSWYDLAKVAVPACSEKGIAVSAVELIYYDHFYGNNIVFNPANYDVTNSATVCDNTGCHKFDPGFSLIDISANGDVTSAWPNGGERTLIGTSMSTPHVTGALAQLYAIKPDASSEEIRQSLYNGATPGYAGNGLLDNADSCKYLVNDTTSSCLGYYVSQFASRANGNDWIKVKIDRTERVFVYSTLNTLTAPLDVEKYISSSKTYKDWQVQEVGDIYVLKQNKSIGKTGRYKVTYEIWSVKESGKKAYINKFKEAAAMKKNADSSYSFISLECQENNGICKNYIVQTAESNNELKDIVFS